MPTTTRADLRTTTQRRSVPVDDGASGAVRTSRLGAARLTLGYDGDDVVQDLTLDIPAGAVTCVVGANACGKSTVLRALGRLLDPRAGQVVIDGEDLHRLPTREVARRLGMLPQSPIAPDGITVTELVARGRHPHQSWFRQWSVDDARVVAAALTATGTDDLAERPVDALSGGQRQRVWIAMVLAQDTELLLLDEPTTFLDLAHQVEVLDLLADLNEKQGRTVVMVLHDLNHAARYAHHLVAMVGGHVVAHGPPAQVVTEELVQEVFGLAARVVPDPVTGTPMVVPLDRASRRCAPGTPPSPSLATPHRDAQEAP